MIIGHAGGPRDGPEEKVAGTEEQISLPGGEEARCASGVHQLLSSSLFGEGSLQQGHIIKHQSNLQFV